jgi:HK97 family phage portal protein
MAVSGKNYSGQQVDEDAALGISAVYRAVALLSGTLAQLPLRTLREEDNGLRKRIKSFYDAPGGPDGLTAYEWKETILCHLLLHGDAFLVHIYNAAGALIALQPMHPSSVTVTWPLKGETPRGGKWYDVSFIDGTQKRYDADGLTQIPSISMDGLRGLSVVSYAANSLGTAIAGDLASAKAFDRGALFAGIVSATNDDMQREDADNLKAAIERSMTGIEHSAGLVVSDKDIKFQQWNMSARDAQFLESRQFQIEEIARWFGIPPHLLMQTEKQTSWGTGVDEQNRGLSKFVLGPWAKRIEERLSRLLPSPRFVEFDFAGLERPNVQTEVDLLIKELQAGLLTLDEARAIRNRPPVPKTEEPPADDTVDPEDDNAPAE